MAFGLWIQNLLWFHQPPQPLVSIYSIHTPPPTQLPPWPSPEVQFQPLCQLLLQV